MLRRLVDEVFHVGAIILLKDLLLVRHGKVHDPLHFGTSSWTRIDANTLLFFLHNDLSQLVDPAHPLDLVILLCLLIRPVIVTCCSCNFVKTRILRIR